MNTLKTVYIATIITGLFTGLFLSSSASAQDISGTWHGKLTVPTGSLTIVFHINQAAQRNLCNNARQSRPGSQRHKDTSYLFQ